MTKQVADSFDSPRTRIHNIDSIIITRKNTNAVVIFLLVVSILSNLGITIVFTTVVIIVIVVLS